MRFRAPVCALVLSCLATALPAQEKDAQSHPGASHPNHASVFLGLVTNGETGPAIGAAYRRQVRPRIAVGPIVETAFYEHETAWALIAAVTWTGWNRLALRAGPGLELVDGESEFLFRVGAGWEFPVADRQAIEPEIALDFVGGETKVVLGASYGVGW